MRFIDPTGEFPIETIWDIGNLVYDVGAAVVNHIKGEHEIAQSHWGDAAMDLGSILIPYVPAGVTKSAKLGKIGVSALDKSMDAGSKANRTVDAAKTIEKGTQVINNAGKYSNIPDPRNAGVGKATTKSQRAKILEQNRNANGGVLRSDGDGRLLSEPQKSVKGQKANMNQAEVDHMTPKSKGGTNKNSNLQVLSKEENLKKGSNVGP